MEEYHKLIPKADPVDDWEDRNILYSMYEASFIYGPTPYGYDLRPTLINNRLF